MPGLQSHHLVLKERVLSSGRGQISCDGACLSALLRGYQAPPVLVAEASHHSLAKGGV